MYRFFFCGKTGIRTRDTLLTYTRFPGVPLQPLEHLSLTNIFIRGAKLSNSCHINEFLTHFF